MRAWAGDVDGDDGRGGGEADVVPVGERRQSEERGQIRVIFLFFVGKIVILSEWTKKTDQTNQSNQIRLK